MLTANKVYIIEDLENNILYYYCCCLFFPSNPQISPVQAAGVAAGVAA